MVSRDFAGAMGANGGSEHVALDTRRNELPLSVDDADLLAQCRPDL